MKGRNGGPRVSSEIRLGRLQESLRTKRFGKHLFYSSELSSTNDWARELAEMGAEEGTVTVAQNQTAGRGRLGRKWISPRGGLWFSIVLRPSLKASGAAKLVFVASLAVAEVLVEKYGLRTETKWPNDVLVNGKKICGILAEMNTGKEGINYAVLGIGVNANFAGNVLPESLKAAATSIQKETGKKVRLESLLKTLLEKLEMTYDTYLKEGYAPIAERWKGYASFLGRNVEITDGNERFKGLALAVDPEGALVLRLEDGTEKRVLTGDVSQAHYKT